MITGVQSSKSRHNLFSKVDHDQEFIRTNYKTPKKDPENNNTPLLMNNLDIRRRLAAETLSLKLKSKAPIITVAKTMMLEDKNPFLDSNFESKIGVNEDENSDIESNHSEHSDKLENLKKAISSKNVTENHEIKILKEKPIPQRHVDDYSFIEVKSDLYSSSDESEDDKGLIRQKSYIRDRVKHKSMRDVHQHIMKKAKSRGNLKKIKSTASIKHLSIKNLNSQSEQDQLMDDSNTLVDEDKTITSSFSPPKLSNSPSFLFLSSLSNQKFKNLTDKQKETKLRQIEEEEKKEMGKHLNPYIPHGSTIKVLDQPFSSLTTASINASYGLSLQSFKKPENKHIQPYISLKNTLEGKSEKNGDYWSVRSEVVGKKSENSGVLNKPLHPTEPLAALNNEKKPILTKLDDVVQNFSFVPKPLIVPEKPKTPQKIELNTVFDKELIQADIPKGKEISDAHFEAMLNSSSRAEDAAKIAKNFHKISKKQAKIDKKHTENANSCENSSKTDFDNRLPKIKMYKSPEKNDLNSKLSPPKLDFSNLPEPSISSDGSVQSDHHTEITNNSQKSNLLSPSEKSNYSYCTMASNVVTLKTQNSSLPLIAKPNSADQKPLNTHSSMVKRLLMSGVKFSSDAEVSDGAKVKPGFLSEGNSPLKGNAPLVLYPINKTPLEIQKESKNPNDPPLIKNYRTSLNHDTRDYVSTIVDTEGDKSGFYRDPNEGLNELETGKKRDLVWEMYSLDDENEGFSENDDLVFQHSTTSFVDKNYNHGSKFGFYQRGLSQDNKEGLNEKPAVFSERHIQNIEKTTTGAAPPVIYIPNQDKFFNPAETQKPNSVSDLNPGLVIGDESFDGVRSVMKNPKSGNKSHIIHYEAGEKNIFSDDDIDDDEKSFAENSTINSKLNIITKNKKYHSVMDIKSEINEYINKLNQASSPEKKIDLNNSFMTVGSNINKEESKNKLWEKLRNRYAEDNEGFHELQKKIKNYVYEGVKEEAQILKEYLFEIDDW